MNQHEYALNGITQQDSTIHSRLELLSRNPQIRTSDEQNLLLWIRNNKTCDLCKRPSHDRNIYTVIHNYRTPFIYYCEINSNEQNFTKLWLQFRHALPH